MEALVTGATSGIGLEYCRQLAARGHNLLMVSNQQHLLDTLPATLSSQYGIRAIGHFQDLSQEDAAQRLYDWCRQQGLEIDILINNAGIFFFHALTPELYDRADTLLRLHTVTPTRLCLLFGEAMKRRGGGYIINMSSLAASTPFPGITLYSATKAYLKNFSMALHYELAPCGVTVTTVIPGAIATDLYGLTPKLMKIAMGIGLIMPPRWLVRKALRRMFRHKAIVRPGASNVYGPVMMKLLPQGIKAALWRVLNDKIISKASN